MNLNAVKVIQDSNLSKESKSIGIMGALMNADPDVIIKGMVSMQDSIDSKKSEGETPKLTKPKDYTKTQSIIHDMMTENTGIAMMDSGGDYGRAWQQNRMIQDFRNLPAIKTEIFGYYRRGELPSISKNLFHFLVDNLEYSANMTKKYKQFAKLAKYNDSYDMEIIEDFANRYQTRTNYPESVIQDNSYNHETCLSGDIQYCIFANELDSYVILQIHGGADIRGGYTDPKVFKCSEGWDYFLINQSNLNASCGCEGLYPYSDDAGYHWYDTGNNEDNKEKRYNFPKIWHWSERLQGIYCQDCKKRVGFY